MAEDTKYRIRYRIESGEFTKAELEKAGDGGCQALVFVSIMRGPEPHGGPASSALMSRDGYTGKELGATELFRVWSEMALIIARDLDGPKWQKSIARDAFEKVRAKIAGTP